MDSLQDGKTNVTELLAADLVRHIYGFEVTFVKVMDSFDGQNFHIKVSKDHHNPYIYKLCEEGYTLKIENSKKCNNIASTHRILSHLHQKGIHAPCPVQNLDGDTWKFEEVPLLNNDQGKTTQSGVHLLTYIEGSPVATVPYTPELLFQWGLLLAKCQNALMDLEYPESSYKAPFWSLENTPEVANYIQNLDKEKIKLVTYALQKYQEQIPQKIAQLAKGIIHGDLNETNTLVQISIDGKCSVEGVLDVEDAHYGSYIWDLGLTLAYALLDCETMNPLEGAGHALAGYVSLRPISALERSLLKVCMECRLCQSLVFGSYSFQKNPSDPYLCHSGKTGWKRLQQLHDTTDEDLYEIWNTVQEQYHH